MQRSTAVLFMIPVISTNKRKGLFPLRLRVALRGVSFATQRYATQRAAVMEIGLYAVGLSRPISNHE